MYIFVKSSHPKSNRDETTLRFIPPGSRGYGETAWWGRCVSPAAQPLTPTKLSMVMSTTCYVCSKSRGW